MHKILPSATNDRMIRDAFKAGLERMIARDYRGRSDVRIVEELGVAHGAARIDLVIVNGLLHGFELKSDSDSLERLPEQMRLYNDVFDRVTLVVGKTHLQKAIEIIPEWWGVTIAKKTDSGEIAFFTLRNDRNNPTQNNTSIAALLWRSEALELLEKRGQADGFRSKNRSVIYAKLATILDKETLKTYVRERLCFRPDWRSDLRCTLGGG